MIAFTRSKGVYGGVNLDGTLVNLSDDWNKAYFGKPVLPPDILIRGTVSNKGANKLLASVAKGTGTAK
jgi:lipid-binding SYLF domain-containing protein